MDPLCGVPWASVQYDGPVWSDDPSIHTGPERTFAAGDHCPGTIDTILGAFTITLAVTLAWPT